MRCAIVGLVVLSGCSLLTDYDAIRPSGGGDAGGDAAVASTHALVPKWLRTIGSPANDEAHACAFDDTGDVYVVGSAQDSAASDELGALQNAGSTDAFIAAYDAEGAGRSIEVYGSEAADGFFDISMAGKTQYLSGYFSADIDFGGGVVSPTGQDAFLLSRDKDGAFRWFSSAVGNGPAIARGIDAANGRVYAVGSFGRDLDGSYDISFYGCSPISGTDSVDGWIAAFDDLDSGKCLWLTYFQSSGSDQANRVVVSPSELGLLGVGGRVNGLPVFAPANHDLHFSEMTTAGNVRWVVTDFTTDGFEEAADMVATGVNTCGVGRFSSPIDFVNGGEPVDPGVGADGFVSCRLVNGGDHHWTRTFGSSAEARLDGAAVLGQTIVAAGSFEGAMEIESPTLEAVGVTDGLVVALDSATGELQAATSFGGTGSVLVFGVAARDGRVCVAGRFDHSLAVGADERASVSDSHDAFVAVFELVQP